MESASIFSLAASKGIVLSELTPQRTSLEEAYMALTENSVEYRTGAGVDSGVDSAAAA